MGNRKKYNLEFIIHATPSMIFNLISDPQGLSRWFAEVTVEHDNIYNFNWEGATEKARLERLQKNKLARFHWLDHPENEYLSFEINVDELTGDVALIITDFEDESEIEDAAQVWQASVEQLKAAIGA